MTDDLPLRIATADDHPALAELLTSAFLHDVEDEAVERNRLVFEPDRAHLIEDAGAPVATGAIYTRAMTVPGAVIPVAHVTGVAVAATHRRRGLLTRIIYTQLASIRDLGTESVAALWATEGGIYGRFGYGIAARHCEYMINRSLVQVTGPAPSGTLVQVKPNDAAEELAAVFERVRTERPGWSSRPGKWWDVLLTDIASRREGMSSLRAVLFARTTHLPALPSGG
jgi:predicted acetyltransferase